MFRKISSWAAMSALAVICISSFSLMLWASRTDSAIADEWAHIPAGYAYVHNFDYRFNPEHPPLVKALAMIPVLFLHPIWPTDNPAWTTEVNGQWDMGTAFLYDSGNNANAIIQWARVMPMLLTIFTIILVYLFARRLMGKLWALLPAALFAFDPLVLAHGHYVTTDVGAAFGVLFSMYFFVKYLETPTAKYLWYAGLSFGVAQLTKFSTPFLIPAYIVVILALALIGHKPVRTFLRSLWKVLLIFAIGYVLVVYPVYFLFTSNYPMPRQVADTEYLLGSFAGGPTPAGHWCSPTRCLADADIWLAGNRITRPVAEYLLGGLMVLQRADGGNTIYFLGEVRNSGGWIYFPVLFLLKEPIPTLIILIVALFVGLWGMFRRKPGEERRERIRNHTGTHIAEFTMGTFIVLYLAYSLHTPLNIGLRHLMPIIPLMFILAAGVWKKWIVRLDFRAVLRSLTGSAIKYIVLVLLVVWLILESLFAAPYFLSYYNEFGGGVYGGYHYVTDSNYDWGQDLIRLQSWVNDHPEVDKIAVDYFGGGNPYYYLGSKDVFWNATMGDPRDQGIHWFAISINTLQNAIQPLAPDGTRDPVNQYTWLLAMRPPTSTPSFWPWSGMGDVPAPDYRVGTSIFVYHLP